MSGRHAGPGAWAGAPDLTADCSRCVALCCVAPAVTRSADFAIDKPAGVPCPNLTGDDRCAVHARLRVIGFPGCSVFDCLGAGQRVTQAFAGRTWRQDPGTHREMVTAFDVVRRVHELLRHAREAAALATGTPEAHATDARLRHLDDLARRAAEEAADVDAAAEQAALAPVLRAVSQRVRSAGAPPGADHAGADLSGADLRGADLRRSCLRGALLLGADLRGADLREADLLGADLRGARLDGADLRGAIFVTPMQLASAGGDATTRLPVWASAPLHWSAVSAGAAPPPRTGGPFPRVG